MARNGGAQRPTLQFISLSLLLVLLKDELAVTEVAAASSSLALPGCQDKCGNVSIPYPFGIGSNCSKDSSFEVSCDSTAAAGYTPTISIGFPKASEVIEILPENKVKIITNRLWLFNASYNESQYFLNLINTPFYLSQDRNVFTTVGCDILGYMISGGIRVG
ncbi:PREDICTED: wall-associated receptor kinase-like 8, partial [Nelumbo nucifera]